MTTSGYTAFKDIKNNTNAEACAATRVLRTRSRGVPARAELAAIPAHDWLLLALLALVFSTRVLFGALAFDRVIPRQGGDGYELLAWNLLQNGTYGFEEGVPTMHRPPGYPFFLLPVIGLFGFDRLALTVYQALVSVLTGVVLYRFGRALLPRSAALLGLGLYAVFPHSVVYAPQFFTESLYLFLIVLFAWYLYRLFREPTVHHAIGAGASLGLTVLVKSTLAVFPVVTLALLALLRPARARPARVVGLWLVYCASAGLVLTPWILRNAVLSERFVPLSTMGGPALYQGFWYSKNFPLFGNDLQDLNQQGMVRADEVWRGHRVIDPDGKPLLMEVERDAFLRARLRQELLAEPGTVIRVFLKGLAVVWFHTFSRAFTVFSLFYYLPMVLLAVVGWLAQARATPTDRALLPLAVLVGYFVAFHALFYIHIRYVVPVYPIVFLFSARGLLFLTATASRAVLAPLPFKVVFPEKPV